MPHQISITGVTGTSPYSITVCDVTLMYCYLITGSTTIPPTFIFDVPSPLDVAESVIVKKYFILIVVLQLQHPHHHLHLHQLQHQQELVDVFRLQILE